MCRFTAYVGPPRPLDLLVYGGAHPLLEQAWAPRELLSGGVNADGWGVAWYGGVTGHDDGVPARLAGTRPVWQEEGLRRVLGRLRSPMALAALRNATPGLPVEERAVPPLVEARWSFVLNGFVPDFPERHARPLRASLPDPLYARLRGGSDAETLLLMAAARGEAGAEPGEALTAVAQEVLARVQGAPCQLTMALADGATLALLRTSNVEEVNSLYLAEGGALAPGGVLVASERLDADPGWRPVPPGVVVEITREGVVRRR